MATFKFMSDPGHGWLRVPIANLIAVDLSLADISPYSGRKGDTLYLEEDCDAPKFIAAYEKKFGGKPAFSESFTNSRSFIRSLPRARED